MNSFRNKLFDGKAKNLFGLYAQYWKRLVLDFSKQMKSEAAKFSLQVLTQCFVLSCNQFLYQFKLIS